MHSYVFALAGEGDAAEVLALYRSLIGTPGCTWDLDYPDGETVLRDIAEGSLYLLRQGDRIVSAAAAGQSDELAALDWRAKNPCDLARIGVLADCQRRGVGTRMLRSVVEAVRARGFDGIRILVARDNARALALYDKNGFCRGRAVRMFDLDF
ncbi:MAG: GNAT family N-acetyltransferase [Clostridiales bacterium]|nr:GNAT family N-acetyltransferase [Clostridiales bacterium]